MMAKLKTISVILGSLTILPSVAQINEVDSANVFRQKVMLPDSMQITDRMSAPELPTYGYSETAEPHLRATDETTFHGISSLKWHPGFSDLASWGSGGISAFGATQSMPGLMGIESGGLGLTQRFGNLLLTADAEATKYGYFRGLQTSYGFGGSLTYNFNERVSMTVFGEYHTQTSINQPAMAGYVSVPRWGGYVNYQFHEHWGVKVGAQAYQSVMGRRVGAQPIVMPYYKLSNGAELGIDVGGILYNLVKSNRGNRRSNPTIGPLLPGPPPVR